jgi:hypothetical protein
VTRFFQQSLPKCCSNFTKLRKILPNVGFPNNYVIIIQKTIVTYQSRKNIYKQVSRNTCCFHGIAVFANDKALFLRLAVPFLRNFHCGGKREKKGRTKNMSRRGLANARV